MIRMPLIAAAALAALATIASPAVAAPNAYAKQDSDVFKNPNSNSMVVNEIEAGQLVTVLDCQGNYCKLQLPGPDGWVRQNRLGGLKSGKPSSSIPFSFGFSIGGDGKPSVSIGIGNGGPVIEPEEPEIDQVCFYKSANFNGSSFCAEPGDSDDSLSGSWNNNISSIEVFGDAEVLVCRDEELSGVCAEITSSKASLPNALNNRISSYEVN